MRWPADYLHVRAPPSTSTHAHRFTRYAPLDRESRCEERKQYVLACIEMIKQLLDGICYKRAVCCSMWNNAANDPRCLSDCFYCPTWPLSALENCLGAFERTVICIAIVLSINFLFDNVNVRCMGDSILEIEMLPEDTR